MISKLVETKYRPNLDDLISLYRDRKIPTYATVFKIAKGLAGNTGAPKAAVKMMKKYYQAPTAKERNIKVAKENQLKTYFVKGKVNTTTTYSSMTNKEAKKVVIKHRLIQGCEGDQGEVGSRGTDNVRCDGDPRFRTERLFQGCRRK